MTTERGKAGSGGDANWFQRQVVVVALVLLHTLFLLVRAAAGDDARTTARAIEAESVPFLLLLGWLAANAGARAASPVFSLPGAMRALLRSQSTCALAAGFGTMASVVPVALAGGDQVSLRYLPVAVVGAVGTVVVVGTVAFTAASHLGRRGGLVTALAAHAVASLGLVFLPGSSAVARLLRTLVPSFTHTPLDAALAGARGAPIHSLVDALASGVEAAAFVVALAALARGARCPDH